MRRFVVVALMAVLTSGGTASAQDEEAEGGDLDALMSGDPERPPAADKDAEASRDDEAPGGSDEMGMLDDERPPGDEPSVKAPAKERDFEAEADTGHPNPFSLGVLAGYGISLESGGNAWNFGLGLRGGYNFSAIYLGARFVYYFGETFETTRITVLGNTLTEEASVSLWEFGFEGGYDIYAGSLAFRPGVGFGFATVDSTQSKTAFYIAPGLSILYEFSEALFLGLDARYQAVTVTPTASGIVLLANLGMRL